MISPVGFIKPLGQSNRGNSHDASSRLAAPIERKRVMPVRVPHVFFGLSFFSLAAFSIAACASDAGGDNVGANSSDIEHNYTQLVVDYAWGRPSPQGLHNAGYT